MFITKQIGECGSYWQQFTVFIFQDSKKSFKLGLQTNKNRLKNSILFNFRFIFTALYYQKF